MLALVFVACGTNKNKSADNKSTSASVVQTAVDAYIWAYPMVTIGVTSKVATNTPKPLPNAYAPINTFGHVNRLFTDEDKDVVSSNVDNLYSSAFLDLTQGAVQISVPATDGRYYSMMLSDAYSNVFDYIGLRATGTDAGKYLIKGPDWKGQVPDDIDKVFEAPTNLVWVIGRTLIDGQEDIENVRKIQSQYVATLIPPATASPASWSERNDFPAFELKPPVMVVNSMDWKTYFTWAGKLLKENHVPDAHKDYIAKFKRIGLTEENGFDPSVLSEDDQIEMEKAVAEAQKKLADEAKKKIGVIHEGWFYSLDAGVWGDNYLLRGAIAYRSIGQNIPEEAIYMNTNEDKGGNVLDASKHNYKITFAKGELPPVDAFWSMTMYNEHNFFVENPIGRLAIGDRTNSMQLNDDGSLTIYFQKDAPKGFEGNWLPAPDGIFRISLRLYIPKKVVLSGDWSPPGIEQL